MHTNMWIKSVRMPIHLNILESLINLAGKALLNKYLLFTLLGIIILLGAFGIVSYAPGKSYNDEPVFYAEEEPTEQEKTILSEEELFVEINYLREQYLVNPLKKESSTCAIARARVEEIYEKSINVFGVSSSFQRTIDKVLKENSSFVSTTPEYFREYLTYEESVEDAIESWRQNDPSIFDELDYKYGCVAEKEGYAIVIVGYNKLQPVHTKEKNYNQTETAPKGIEKSAAESI